MRAECSSLSHLCVEKKYLKKLVQLINWFDSDTKQNDLRTILIFTVQCAYKQCTNIDAEAPQV